MWGGENKGGRGCRTEEASAEKRDFLSVMFLAYPDKNPVLLLVLKKSFIDILVFSVLFSLSLNSSERRLACDPKRCSIEASR